MQLLLEPHADKLGFALQRCYALAEMNYHLLDLGTLCVLKSDPLSSKETSLHSPVRRIML